VITSEHFYQIETHQAGSSEGPVNLIETFSEIQSIDESAGHLVIRAQWVRSNGVFGGFGHPTATVTYSVDGDELRIAILRIDETQFPDAPDPEPYYRR
jgi:hypothetical protein